MCRFRFFVFRFSPKLIAIELAGKRRIIQGWPARQTRSRFKVLVVAWKLIGEALYSLGAANMKRFCLANALFYPLDGKIFSPIKEKHKSGSVDARCHRMFPSLLLFIVFAPKAAFVQTGETSIRSLWIFDKLIRTWGELFELFLLHFSRNLFSALESVDVTHHRKSNFSWIFYFTFSSLVHWFSTSFHRLISIFKIISLRQLHLKMLPIIIFQLWPKDNLNWFICLHLRCNSTLDSRLLSFFRLN